MNRPALDVNIDDVLAMRFSPDSGPRDFSRVRLTTTHGWAKLSQEAKEMRRQLAVACMLRTIGALGGGTKIFGADGLHSVRDGKSPINRVLAPRGEPQSCKMLDLDPISRSPPDRGFQRGSL